MQVQSGRYAPSFKGFAYLGIFVVKLYPDKYEKQKLKWATKGWAIIMRQHGWHGKCYICSFLIYFPWFVWIHLMIFMIRFFPTIIVYAICKQWNSQILIPSESRFCCCYWSRCIRLICYLKVETEMNFL